MANVIEPELVEGPYKFDLFGNILALRANIKNVKNAMATAVDPGELLDELTTLEDLLEVANWELGIIVGYDTLFAIRTLWGLQASKYNRLQEAAYKAQKERYVNCRYTLNHFTREDREFIRINKESNEMYMSMQHACEDCRATISDIIDAAFPNAPYDDGYDETYE